MNGAAWLFWARLWLSLLAVSDLTGIPSFGGNEESLGDFMQNALTGDLPNLAERLYG